MPPLLTFLMPVYNAAPTVRAAIESVLAQTHGDFEFLILDDGSTDNTADLVRAFRDPRVRLHHNEKNIGLSASLNRGLDLIQTPYVARMDADDLCLPHRIDTQLAYFKAHPNVAVVGSFVETFSASANSGEIITYPTAPAAVAATLLFRSALAHPAVMFDRAALASRSLRYNTHYWGAQDYALWLACVENNLPLANIDQVLLRYRLHDQQLSHSMDRMQSEGTEIRSNFLKNWLTAFTPLTANELALHDAIARDRLTPAPDFLLPAIAWLHKLWQSNLTLPRFTHTALGPILCGRWVRLLQTAQSLNLPIDINTSPLAPFLHPQTRALFN